MRKAWFGAFAVGVMAAVLPWAAPAHAALKPGTYAYVVNSTAGTVSVIDTSTNTVVGEPINLGGSPAKAVASKDGKKVYVTTGSGNGLVVINTTDNTFKSIPLEGAGTTGGIALTPDGTHVYVLTRTNPGRVYVVSTATDTQVGQPIQVLDTPTDIAFLPNGQFAYVGHLNSSQVSIITVATGQVTGNVSILAEQKDLVASPNGAQVYVATGAGDPANSIVTINTTNNQVTGTPIAVGTNPTAIAIRSQGDKLYVTNAGSNNVSVVTISSGAVKQVPVGNVPTEVALTPDGSKAYVTNGGIDGNSVSVINTTDDTVTGQPIPVGTGPTGLAMVTIAPLVITTTTVPAATTGTAFNATLAATGGTAPFTWSVNSGTLPAGLTLNATTGAITGTPTATGTAAVTLRVTDASGATADQALNFVVTAAASPSPSPTATATATQDAVIQTEATTGATTSDPLATTGAPAGRMAASGAVLLVLGVVAAFLGRRRLTHLGQHRGPDGTT